MVCTWFEFGFILMSPRIYICICTYARIFIHICLNTCVYAHMCMYQLYAMIASGSHNSTVVLPKRAI